MQTLTDLPALNAWRKKQRSAGKTVALVPTMGNLHEGHLSLVKLAKERADQCLVSIFVNPTQFGPDEDLAAYPRTLSADLEKLATIGAEAVFAPASPDILYGPAPIQLIAPPSLAQRLCGIYRPGHFDGVLQVVNKLFNLCAPDVAVFGEKDYQQLLLIRKMVVDFFQPITIIGAPLIREHSGLAMSSRNRYLTEAEKVQAASLYRHLHQTAQALIANALRSSEDCSEHCQAQMAALNAEGFKMQYYEICDAHTLAPLGSAQPATTDLATASSVASPTATNLITPSTSLVVLAAGYLGKTRLIDNIQLKSNE